MNVSYPFIMRPVGTTLLAIGLLLIGIVAYRFLPVASMPNVELPTIRVSASRPGADPAIMAATVAAPLERNLGSIAGVTEITSVSSLGTTNITVQFDLNRKIDGAARDVQAAINASLTDLPSDLPSIPSFRKSNPAALPVLILALTSKTVLPSAIYDAADTVVAQRIAQVSGVADVTVSGAEQPAVRVRVNPGAIAAAGISLEQVRTAIAGANAQSPLGVLDGSDLSTTIGTNDQLRRAPDYKTLVVKTNNGNIVRLSDIASVEQSTRNSRSAAWFNRQPSVLLIITKQGDANVIETVDNIRALIPEIKKLDSLRHRRLDPVRPHRHDPRQRRRHAAHFARHHRHGDAGGVRVPAPRDADDRGRHHGAALARRHLRADVVRRLLDRQSLADGARGLGRLRGRRRDRDDRERVPQHGEGALAAARHHRGRAPDRLHGDLDQHLAGRGVHSAAVHGRHRRPRVPRILGDAGVRDPGLDHRVAHRHADDLRALRAQRAEPDRDALRPHRRMGAVAA